MILEVGLAMPVPRRKQVVLVSETKEIDYWTGWGRG